MSGEVEVEIKHVTPSANGWRKHGCRCSGCEAGYEAYKARARARGRDRHATVGRRGREIPEVPATELAELLDRIRPGVRRTLGAGPAGGRMGA